MSTSRVSQTVFGALLLVCGACRRSPAPDPAPVASAGRSKSVARPDREAPSAAPGLGAGGSGGPERCKATLARSEFTDCNPKPTQKAYPECYSYLIEPAEEERDACLPRQVVFSVSGWPSRLDVVRARVEYGGPEPREASLVMVRLESSATGEFEPRPGAKLGSVGFEGGKAHELRLERGVPSWTGSKVLVVQPP